MTKHQLSSPTCSLWILVARTDVSFIMHTIPHLVRWVLWLSCAMALSYSGHYFTIEAGDYPPQQAGYYDLKFDWR